MLKNSVNDGRERGAVAQHKQHADDEKDEHDWGDDPVFAGFDEREKFFENRKAAHEVSLKLILVAGFVCRRDGAWDPVAVFFVFKRAHEIGAAEPRDQRDGQHEDKINQHEDDAVHDASHEKACHHPDFLHRLQECGKQDCRDQEEQ